MPDFRRRLSRLMAGRLCVRHARRWECTRCASADPSALEALPEWPRLLELVARTGWRPHWRRCPRCGQRTAACWPCERDRLLAAVQATLSPADLAEYHDLRRKCLKALETP